MAAGLGPPGAAIGWHLSLPHLSIAAGSADRIGSGACGTAVALVRGYLELVRSVMHKRTAMSPMPTLADLERLESV